jgi:CheY-like chemotaxis protein
MVVLYAEDDIDDFNIFCEVLESVNPLIKVINARNGVEALDILENLPSIPDFIFLDINMPSMDGTACLKRVKNDPRLNIFRSLFTQQVLTKDTGTNVCSLALLNF